MRPVLALWLLLAGSLGAQPGSVEGTVKDLSTKKPLSGVHVRLVVFDFDFMSDKVSAYGASSDAAGHFAMANVPPGIYAEMAEKPGFLQTAAQSAALGFSLVTLKPAQHLTELTLEMTPQAVISGHVLDEYGDPLQNIRVGVEAVPPAKQVGQWSGDVTDDRGEFRMVGLPGKYLLVATFYNRASGPPELRTDGSSSAPFAPTYYPSAVSASGAATVQAAGGQELAGVDIRMVRSSARPVARALTVSGIVTGAPASGGANVMLRFGETAGNFNNGRSTQAGPDGKFRFPGMMPGYYIATATYGTGKDMLQSRTLTFQLGEADEAGLQLNLAPGEDVNGVLALVGDAPAAGTKRTVRLDNNGDFNYLGQRLTADVGKDGQFRVSNVPPGKYKAVVDPMPENGYVQSVSLDGKEAAVGQLDFSQGVGGARLKITVSLKSATVSGRLLTETGESSGSMVAVVLASSPSEVTGGGDDKPTTNGKYALTAVRPGKYRIFALDVVALLPFLVDADESEFAKLFFAAAEEIEVKEGDRLTKDLTVLTKMPEKK